MKPLSNFLKLPTSTPPPPPLTNANVIHLHGSNFCVSSLEPSSGYFYHAPRTLQAWHVITPMLQPKRLHISPFTPESLPTILRPPLTDQATDISFHNLETFPEKPYGFVTLPSAEADKLKKKLHGATLRGVKMRVEEARPKKSLENVHTEEESENQKPNRKSGRSKKHGAKEENVLPGVELEKDRKVKRGWTQSGSENKKKSEKYKDKADKKSKPKATSITGQSECLFRTNVPPKR